ncbi:sporulation protein YqfD [Bacillus sp. 165]|uniref:sporulation protein YqfD n=1 Tax=Bacillus sp. 165 TaxID=1529117 RepID=UPI001ADC7A3D|nr:sporulation protein YqfD [Bacillus sp. 165]MBO9129596.1 sporulation protein YqfD [Bacillus sp. 165]
MKNQWVILFGGHVKVRLSGRGTERFVNECVRRGIYVWNVKKVGTETITCYVMLRDVPKLRIIYRKNECDIRFIGRYGLPFFRKKLLKNSGFLIGFITFFVCLILLSNMVWSIEIDGAKPETEYLIMKELDALGVKRGKLQFQLKDVESLQRYLTNNVNSITWVGVELRGTTYHFQVVEKNEPKKEEALQPRNLIAKKEAVITRTFVEQGKNMVQENDHVEKGQLLVSGIYGNEENPTIVPAKGVIFGETWYKSSVEIPLSTKFQVYTGSFFKKYYINVGKLQIKVWGFEKNKYKAYKEDSMKYDVHFLRWTLPISYEKVTVREEEEAHRDYTQKQAVKTGIDIARSELKKKLDEHARIIGEKVLRKSTKDGKVKLELHFKVIENIATEQPISESEIQGD